MTGAASPVERARSHELFARARNVLAGGVDSPVRSFAAVGGEPFFVRSARGGYLFDVDGNEYLDLVQSWGASILGHAHSTVVAAVSDAAAHGTSYGAPTLGEVLLAEAIAGRVPGVEMARLVSSGTEAAMTAIRLARGVTGRDQIVKFAGCYHGHSDALLAAGGSGVATLGLSGSKGVPAGAVADTLVVPYNAVPDLDEAVAAVIVEPVAANMGLVPPEEGFLEGLRRACDDVGALLIFDEVITGFRLGTGGAATHYSVTPDLYCLGKVIGGGLPLGALAGRAEHLEQLAPTGPIYQAGTLSGNPVATAAGLAVLALLTDELYASLERRVTTFCDSLRSVFADKGIAVQVPQVGTLCGLFFSEQPVRNYDDARAAAANGRYVALFNQLLARRVYLAPSPFEILFVSDAHRDAELDRVLQAVAEASL